jgi:hypothetical protein
VPHKTAAQSRPEILNPIVFVGNSSLIRPRLPEPQYPGVQAIGNMDGFGLSHKLYSNWMSDVVKPHQFRTPSASNWLQEGYERSRADQPNFNKGQGGQWPFEQDGHLPFLYPPVQ